MPPSTDRTDSRYWIAPQILGEASQEGEGRKALALLVNYTYLNADIMRYLTLLEFEEIEVRDLGREEDGPPVYVQLFASDYVVLSTHDPYKLSDGAKEAVRRIAESHEVFEQVFALRAEYEFPDGEVVSLYARRPLPAHEQVEDYYRHLTAALEPLLREGSAIVVEPPTEVATFAQFYEGSAPVYLLPTGDPADDVLILEEIGRNHERVHAIFRGVEGVDPQSLVERWLSENAYRTGDEWYGDVRLASFATSGDQPAATQPYPVDASLGGEIALASYELASNAVEPDQILRLTLLWRAVVPATDDYVVFVHLLDGEGRLVSQHDGQPVGGFKPTTSWQVDETVADNHGLLIPRGTPPGEYQLVTGMYFPATGDRLQVLGQGSDPEQDSVFLAMIRIVAKETVLGGNEND
jgi:hypothetical protein